MARTVLPFPPMYVDQFKAAVVAFHEVRKPLLAQTV